MILDSFFFSHRALSIGIGRDGIGLKVTKIAQTDRQTLIARLIYKDISTSTYFKNANTQKFDFLKNGAHFYAKITCAPHKITPKRAMFEKNLKNKNFSILDHVQ